MRKILILVITICSVYAKSPQEHKKVFTTRETQLITIQNKIELDKYTSPNSANYGYDLKRYGKLIYNDFLTTAQREFTAKENINDKRTNTANND